MTVLKCEQMMGLVLCVLSSAGSLHAQFKQEVPVPVLADRPDESGRRELLAPWYESQSAGIGFRPPADSQMIERGGVNNVIAEFTNDKQGLYLKVSREELQTPQPLSTVKDKDGRVRLGVLQEAMDGFKRANPMAEILRQDVVNVAQADVGLMVARYNLATNRKLMQQAIVQLDTRVYYVLTMTSPGSRSAGTAEDPKERYAVDTFNALLDTVKLLDSRAVVKQQEDRLFRTRALLNVIKKPANLQKVILPRQWLRLVRDGHDIGYSYIEEEKTKVDGRPGILISVRSHTAPDPTSQVDVASRMFVSDDWQNESWSHVVNTTLAGKKPLYSGELGISNVQVHRRVAASQPSAQELLTDTANLKQPAIIQQEEHRLEVRKATKSMTGQPIIRQLPPWYLPQAIQHLLPRVLPLTEPKTYLFAGFVSETGEVMARYVDVGEKAEVTFAGNRILAIPVTQRVTMEGIPTTYYLSPDGQYLGSQTVYPNPGGKTSVIQVIPTDEAIVKKSWVNSQFSKPSESEMPQPPTKNPGN